MKLNELFKDEKLSLSFEVFPPKTDSSFESVKEATEEIAKLRREDELVHSIKDLDYFFNEMNV